MDISQLTAKERKQARKDLLKKIDAYNKQQRKTRRPSFPLSGPSTDLVYKGIIKVTYDRGYVLQTKSLLVESTSTAAEAVAQLFQTLGLRGAPADYALEERNITGEIRVLGSHEMPLRHQLGSSQKQSYTQLRLVQVRDPRPPTTLSSHTRGGAMAAAAIQRADSEESLDRDTKHSIAVPKEEVIDHGISSVEALMEEALQDIPPLVQDIQERLRLLSETIAVDGKPRPGLPSRRMLWDILKPQASALVKDIRRLVDSGEFITNKHCTSPDVKLMVTLSLELITDHTRELVSITKQMCSLGGYPCVEFSASLSSFVQQITNISRLVSQCQGILQAMAITAHLLDATAPEGFIHGPLQADSYFRGSGAVSGVLIFCLVSALLGLIRAAYEDKTEYFASLTSNALKSTQQALNSIQKTNEYSRLHLHPLKSRVRDMEHKVKVAMDNLIRAVKMAASSRPLPYFSPDMLLCGHQLTLATLDFFMVAQCASLMHRLVIPGRNLMQLPWVKLYTGSDSGQDTKSEATGTVVEQLSSISDSTSSTGDSGGHYKGERTLERQSRIY